MNGPQALDHTAAGAVPGENASDITGFVADQGKRFHADGGDDQLAFLPVGKHRAVRADDFGDDIILPKVHTFVSRAGDGPGHSHLPGTIVGEKARA